MTCDKCGKPVEIKYPDADYYVCTNILCPMVNKIVSATEMYMKKAKAKKCPTTLNNSSTPNTAERSK